MPRTNVIDDEFIAEWHPRYDESEHDERMYQSLVKKVQEEVSELRTISRPTFKQIYEWKAARAKRHVQWKKFQMYDAALRRVLRKSDDRKAETLVGLPGLRMPVASTILHFIYPKRFPIVDYRTVETLQHFDCLDKSRSRYFFRDTIAGYRVFQRVMLNIARQRQKWSLRQIDRALFAYHKEELKPKRRA